MTYLHYPTLPSTNTWLLQHAACYPAGAVVSTDWQGSGRGCGSNTWESERGMNALFSILLHPTELPPARQFRISMAHALALRHVLAHYADGITIKWPNDIYCGHRKLAGTLIETNIARARLQDVVIGTGINVRQTVFRSPAPNPVSLAQVSDHLPDLPDLIRCVAEHTVSLLTAPRDLTPEYNAALYRRTGCHQYRDAAGTFLAAVDHVEPDGTLILRDQQGRTRQYHFKEIQFIL